MEKVTKPSLVILRCFAVVMPTIGIPHTGVRVKKNQT